MKIGIASEGKTLDSDVCPTAGRAPFYLVFEDKKLVKTIKNPFANGGGGAGFGVVQMLSNDGVEKIISGKFGDKLLDALKEKNMMNEEVSGKTVQEVLNSQE